MSKHSRVIMFTDGQTDRQTDTHTHTNSWSSSDTTCIIVCNDKGNSVNIENLNITTQKCSPQNILNKFKIMHTTKTKFVAIFFFLQKSHRWALGM